MQLTPFDRWLREKFVYETHIQTLRPPPSIPRGIRPVTLPNASNQRYQHLFVARSNKIAQLFISQLKDSGQMYTTRIVDRTAWFVPFIAPKQASVTWWLISWTLIITSSLVALLYVKSLLDNPEIQQNLRDTLKILKG